MCFLRRQRQRMITALHHAQITIPPHTEEQARDFYCRLLGLAEVPKPQSQQGRGGLWLRVGEQSVHIGVEEGVDRSRTKAHLAYAVSDLEHWRRLLQDHGIAVLEGLPIPGHARFEFRDPFGNRVEMIQPL